MTPHRPRTRETGRRAEADLTNIQWANRLGKTVTVQWTGGVRRGTLVCLSRDWVLVDKTTIFRNRIRSVS